MHIGAASPWAGSRQWGPACDWWLARGPNSLWLPLPRARVPARLNICNYNSPHGRLQARIRFTLANNSHPSLSLFSRSRHRIWSPSPRRNFEQKRNKIHGFPSTFDRNRRFLPKHATISVLNSRWPLIPGPLPSPILQSFQGRGPTGTSTTWHYAWPLSSTRTCSAKTLLKVSLVESGKTAGKKLIPRLVNQTISCHPSQRRVLDPSGWSRSFQGRHLVGHHHHSKTIVLLVWPNNKKETNVWNKTFVLMVSSRFQLKCLHVR